MPPADTNHNPSTRWPIAPRVGTGDRTQKARHASPLQLISNSDSDQDCSWPAAISHRLRTRAVLCFGYLLPMPPKKSAMPPQYEACTG